MGSILYMYKLSNSYRSLSRIGTRYRLDGTGFEFRRGQDILVLQTRPDRLCVTPSLLFSGYGRSFTGVKRSGRGVDLLRQTSADVKNEWNYASAPPPPPNILLWLGRCYLSSLPLPLLLAVTPCSLVNFWKTFYLHLTNCCTFHCIQSQVPTLMLYRHNV
jgi:hypothetical protein